MFQVHGNAGILHVDSQADMTMSIHGLGTDKTIQRTL